MSTPIFFDYATTYACLAAAQAFLEMALKVLALGRTLVATNLQAGVTSILLTYLHWFELAAGSGVVWVEQAEVEAECWALYAQFREEAWIRPFDKNFVSSFLLTSLFVLTALLRVLLLSARSRLRIWGQRG